MRIRGHKINLRQEDDSCCIMLDGRYLLTLNFKEREVVAVCAGVKDYSTAEGGALATNSRGCVIVRPTDGE